jgi:hypothetical protein
MTGFVAPVFLGFPEFNSRIPTKIKKSRTRQGEEQFLVVFQGDADESGRWISQADLNAPGLLAEYQEKKAMRVPKKSPPDGEEGGSTGKRAQSRLIREIRGVIPDGIQWQFVVRFADSEQDEVVSREVMHRSYASQLLRFYESNIERFELLSPPQ